MLECRDVSKSFGAVKALHGVSFALAKGTITALVGDNGAGKSTLVRICATLARPDTGTVTVGGVDVARRPAAARAAIGFVGHESMLDGVLTMRENLVLFGTLYAQTDARARAMELIERLGASAIADTPVAGLSRGQEQTAALCRALMHRPALLLLDEPSTGLDDGAQRRLAAVLSEEAARGVCVFFSTHDAVLLGAAQSRIRLARGKLE